LFSIQKGQQQTAWQVIISDNIENINAVKEKIRDSDK